MSAQNESQKTATRWMPFQCPACFALFRLQKGNTGVKGHCPQCHEILTVPDLRQAPSEKGSAPAPAVQVAKTVAVARKMEPEEVQSWKQDQQQRRRVYVGESTEGGLDWEVKNRREDGRSFSWMVACSSVLMLAVLAAVGIYLVKNAPSKRDENASVVLDDVASAAALEASRALPENPIYLDEKGVDVTEKSVDDYQRFDPIKIRETVEGFLEADTVTARAAFVRRPEVVEPLMRKYYGGENFEPEGFEDLNQTEVRYRDNFLTARVRLADFSAGPIAVERVETGGETTYQVDWESWVGYCEMSVEELMGMKPTEPKLLRIMISEGSYYNYEFNDDQIWTAYRLTFRNSDRTLLAYAKRKSDVGEVLQESLRDHDAVPYTLKVRYPENARSADQVEISELLWSGWIEEIAEKKPDE